MKENGGGAAGEHRWAGVGFGDGRGAQRLQIGGDALHSGTQLGVIRKVGDRITLKGFDAHQVHAVIGARFRLNHKSRGSTGANERPSIPFGAGPPASSTSQPSPTRTLVK